MYPLLDGEFVEGRPCPVHRLAPFHEQGTWCRVVMLGEHLLDSVAPNDKEAFQKVRAGN